MDRVDEHTARKIEINGIVQGVGFRPFIFGLATRYHLKGEVANTSSGVTIHIEGPGKKIHLFLEEMAKKPPPLAYITDIFVHQEKRKGYKNFSIVQSRSNANTSTLISPDIAVCEDCLRELFDPSDRRFHYPFINCTNCGPRYTIIEGIPYDRPKTSMKQFRMCDQCQAEYDNPHDRRFHAQPNACPVCGPKVLLCDNTGKIIHSEDAIEMAARYLLSGDIVAIKGIGGFHLAADARNDSALTRLRNRKQREEKPLALMAENVESIKVFANVDSEEEKLLKIPRRPIVILGKKFPNDISSAVSPRNRYFGVMLAYTPLHYLLLSKVARPLVMTSGNMSEEPIAIDNDEALRRLAKIADYFLIHDRDIYFRNDDSIVCHRAGEIRMVRRSRGYVPTPVFINKKIARVLACGAELKNTVCLTKENRAFLSQHIGDLENLPTYDFFKMTIDHMKKIINVEPEIVACDLHPDYFSTQYALEQTAIPVFQVQHHHAHIAACMAENRSNGPVIGLAFDGAGYGPDNTVWGGEVLVAEEHDFYRAAHLACVRMPGGAISIKEPWRMAVSYLYHVYGENLRQLDIPFIRDRNKDKINIMIKMIEKKINSPETSSLGRLFDGIAALIGVRDRAAFEAQAAMELEMTAKWPVQHCYDYGWTSREDHILSLEPIIKGVVTDLENGVSVAEISGKFHFTLIHMFSKLCCFIRKETNINTAALSGGSFQNNLLLSGLIEKLYGFGFKVLSHRLVPSNDANISLGQAMVAAALHRKGKTGYNRH
ncbi:MAG: carbamoyltransferase HypF [Desulfobacterales bacterium]